MKDAMAAVLVYQTQDLADVMREQLPNIIVVDNGSRPSIKRADICLSKNLFFSGGWNAVMRELRGAARAIWMLNSDVSNVSEEMLATLYGCLGPNQAITPVMTSSGHGHMRRRQRAVLTYHDWIDWVAPLVDLEWFNKEGSFDENLPGYGADIDLCYRTRGRFIIHNRQCIIHGWGETVKRTGDETIHQYQESRAYLIEKHGDLIKKFAPSYYGRFQRGNTSRAGRSVHR